MSAGKIKVFMATSMRRGPVLRGMGESARRLDLDCDIVMDQRYSGCDIAVVWGMPKVTLGSSKGSEKRQAFRNDIVSRHRGPIVVLE